MTDALDPRKEEAEAIKRIAYTVDGMLLHRYLRRVLEHCADFVDDGTLRAHQGRRSLARDLMALMAEGIEGSRERSGAADQPILGRPSQPIGQPGSRSERRRQQWAAERDPADGGQPAAVGDDNPHSA